MGATVSRCEEEQPAEGGDAPQVEQPVEDSPNEEGGQESSDDAGEDEDEEQRPQIEVATTPYDARFPGFNQARTCYTRYNEFYKCKAQKDEADPECKFYQKAYRSLCPGEWVDSWNEQREAGTWYGKY
ncbi:hypothetical protein WJX73_006356 [Symbiochloris irregularis]|uniref:Uncharacterized protein n=1 Tax=Symbiochloris irregularis TaxID=706552 RepID=A0AAW1NZH3_9CHLO